MQLALYDGALTSGKLALFVFVILVKSKETDFLSKPVPRNLYALVMKYDIVAALMLRLKSAERCYVSLQYIKHYSDNIAF